MNASPTPIADQVAVVNEGMAGQAPAEALAAFRVEQAGLNAAGLPTGLTRVGARMPDGALMDVHGRATSMEEARRGQVAVIVFYRGAWCPYCNVTLRTYQNDLAEELAARDITLIAISPQKPDGSLTMQEKNGLTYTVLSDPGSRIGAKLGIVTRPTEDVRQAQAALGLDLTQINADGSHDILMPTVVITDSDGIVRWIDVHPDYTTRTEPAQILAALEGITD
ncbi:peroxiredoxin-like family protein [Actinacidiphila glaucinigra]|uniref:peroxiredoxin-like family protein n=1 Tax=Actinacidiphila glaucinigra TaxID=235986 RepID=UPI003711C7B4